MNEQKNKKRVALVRGSNLNKWEMQNYEGLQQYYDITAFNGRNAFYDTSVIDLPVKTLFSPERMITKVPGLNRILPMFMGGTQVLFGLERALEGFNLVHTVGTETYYTKQCIRAKKRNPDLKIVATIWENIPFAHENFPRQLALKQFNLPGVDHYIAISERSRFALETEGVDPSKITQLFDGVDLEQFKPRKKDPDFLKEVGFSEENFVVMSTGRLVFQKGIVESLIAVSHLIKKDENVRYLVVGRGRWKAKIEGLAKRLGIADKVVITTLPYEKVAVALNSADLFVLPVIPIPNSQEQLCFAIVEAMASGLPIITATTGSVPEVVGDAAISVPAADSMRTTEELLRLHDNMALREELGTRARDRAEKLFNKDTKFLKLREIYDSVLNS